MERSLRATGCSLPLSVIPYDDRLFELPANATWVDLRPFAQMLQPWSSAGGGFRKIAALFERDVALFDADIIHLKNPEEWLAPFESDCFVVADTEFSKATWTYTTRTKSIYRLCTSNWLAKSFNGGFFAFADLQLSPASITRAFSGAERDLLNNLHIAAEQPSLNYLAHSLDLRVVNACLPPYAFESTMAVDYPSDYEPLLKKANGAPFIHFAGGGRSLDLPVSKLFLDHLTKKEVSQVRAEFEKKCRLEKDKAHWPLWVRFLKQAVSLLDSRFEVAWREIEPRA